MLWILVWLLGMAALSWAALTQAIPRFEQKQRSAVVRSVLSNSNTPISMGLKGFTATLSGEVADEQTRHAIVRSLGIHTGVLHVMDRLTVRQTPELALQNQWINPIPGLNPSEVNIAVPLSVPEVDPIDLTGLPEDRPPEAESSANDSSVTEANTPEAPVEDPQVDAQTAADSAEAAEPEAIVVPSVTIELAEPAQAGEAEELLETIEAAPPVAPPATAETPELAGAATEPEAAAESAETSGPAEAEAQAAVEAEAAEAKAEAEAASSSAGS